MKYFALILSVLWLYACSSKQPSSQQTVNSMVVDTSHYTKFDKKIMYRTLPSGDVEKKDIHCTLMYNSQELKVDFTDSVWTFSVQSIQTKPEGITIVLLDKKFTEVFITSDELHIATFTGKSGGGNITLM